MRGSLRWLAPAAVSALALWIVAGPAMAWDGSARHRSSRIVSRPPLAKRFPVWPVALTAQPEVVILQAPVPPPPILPGEALEPVPSVQDLPAVAGIWRSRPAEASFLPVRP